VARARWPAPGAPPAAAAAPATGPAGTDLIFLSGQLPSAVTPATTPPSFGNTETQAESVFTKIADLLKTQGLTEGDVVKMTVFLSKDPAKGAMDFAGMMAAYGRHYGTAAQPNKPTRSTVEVANLVSAGAVIEGEGIAAQKK